MSVLTLESWSADSRAFWWILISRSSLCLFSVSCSCCLRASLRAFSCCCNTNSDLSPSSSQGSSFDIFLWPVKQTPKTWAEQKKNLFSLLLCLTLFKLNTTVKIISLLKTFIMWKLQTNSFKPYTYFLSSNHQPIFNSSNNLSVNYLVYKCILYNHWV